MIDRTLRAQTPVDVIALVGAIHRSVAFVGVAEALATRRLATAVVIGDHIVLAVEGVATGANPGDR